MPEISRFFGVIVTMNFREHNPPHFHVSYGGYEASISIQDLRTLDGSLPNRIKGLVLEWADAHRDELMTNWNLIQSRKHPQKIKPLE